MEYISGLEMLRRYLAKASQVLPFSAGYRSIEPISVGTWGGQWPYEEENRMWDEPISVGTWGGQWPYEEENRMWDDGASSGIHQIMIAHREFIDFIDIEYDRDGTRVWVTHRGEDPSAQRGESLPDKIELDYPREYLTSLSGHYYERCVTSLTFKSNLRKYGPYGKQGGTYFSVSLSKGKIVGFHGRSGLHLDRLGVYLSTSQTQNFETQMNSQRIGPWGGEWPYEAYRMWDDGAWSGIHQIMISHREFIDSIDIEYDRDGTRVWVTHRGEDPSAQGGDSLTRKIELDYPREYLTSLSGHYEGSVTSLTFESNLRKYGPYGKQGGTYFSLPLSKGKIVGFHGRSGWHLDCLGVYLSASQTQNLEKVRKMMAAITVVLLAGITLTVAVVTLVVATPVLIFFSPVLVPVGTVLLLTTIGFLSAGGFGIAALSSLSWIVNYMRGKHPPGADKIDYARQRIASKAKDVKDRAGGYMQNKGEQATQGGS